MNHSILNRKHLIVSLIGSIILFSCNTMTVRGTGRSFDVVHNIEPITEIEIRGNGELLIQNGSEDQLTVTAQEEIHEYLTIQRRGKRLIVGPKEGYHFKTNETLQYVLISNDIKNITVSGAVNITANDYQTETLLIDASGSTDVDMTVNTDHLKIDASGSFDGYLAGNTQRLEIDFSGSADLNAYDLQTEDADIHVSGASTIYVSASKRLDISAAGAAKIFYKGMPAVSQSSAGAISVTHQADPQ